MRIFSSLRSRLLLIGILALLPALALVLYNGAQLREQAAESAKDNALQVRGDLMCNASVTEEDLNGWLKE